jgi:hypothetical protein
MTSPGSSHSPGSSSLPAGAGSRIKGVSLIEIVRVLRKNRLASDALLPPALKGYLHDRILASEWYPEEDYLALLLVLGNILGPLVSGDVWEVIGEAGAEKDFGGVYSSMVKKRDPWSSLALADKIWNLYRDSGRLELKREGPGRARVFLHSYPCACPEVCGTVTGYLKKLVELCDAKNTRVKLVRAPAPDVGPSEWTIEFTESFGG